jgi:prepilin signal peptidase PulO-like enzyme (type II secretory pathway)
MHIICMLITAPQYDVSVAHYICFNSPCQWCFLMICSRLYIFSPCYNFLFYYFIVFPMGLLLNKGCFILLETYLSHCLLTKSWTSKWQLNEFQGSMQQDRGYFQIFWLLLFFNYACYFSPPLPRIIESSLYSTKKSRLFKKLTICENKKNNFLQVLSFIFLRNCYCHDSFTFPFNKAFWIIHPNWCSFTRLKGFGRGKRYMTKFKWYCAIN